LADDTTDVIYMATPIVRMKIAGSSINAHEKSTVSVFIDSNIDCVPRCLTSIVDNLVTKVECLNLAGKRHRLVA